MDAIPVPRTRPSHERGLGLAGHSSPATTRIYDRKRRKVTRDIVERISI
jgi:hypothetical protein